MITIVDQITKPFNSNARDIPNGTIFKGTIGTYKNEVFVRGYDVVMALRSSNGFPTWNVTKDSLTVHDYCPVDATLTITDKR